MKSNVLNNSIGSPYVFHNPSLSPGEQQEILAGMFEQLMIFDKLTLTTSRLNFALTFLIANIGINNVERLIDAGYLEIILWSPILVTGTGMKLPDGTFDESVIYGQPPIVAGTLSDGDLDPETNIYRALNNFNLHKDRKRIFTKRALKHYSVPDGMLVATDAAKLVIDAYKNNNLATLGLPFENEPDQLKPDQRGLLLDLGHKVTETAVLAQYGLKSYENYESYEILKKNLENIGKGYNVAANTTNLFQLENVPDLRALFLAGHLDFESVFKLRHLSTAKYYRKWINEVGESSNMNEVSEAYIGEVDGKLRYFERPSGKLIKTLTLVAMAAALHHAIENPVAAVAAEIPLGLLENFWLDSILKGKNPKMFIDTIRQEVAPEATLEAAQMREIENRSI